MFEKLKERNRLKQEERERQLAEEKKRLLEMSEKELMVEILLELRSINDNIDYNSSEVQREIRLNSH